MKQQGRHRVGRTTHSMSPRMIIMIWLISGLLHVNPCPVIAPGNEMVDLPSSLKPRRKKKALWAPLSGLSTPLSPPLLLSTTEKAMDILPSLLLPHLRKEGHRRRRHQGYNVWSKSMCLYIDALMSSDRKSIQWCSRGSRRLGHDRKSAATALNVW